MAAVEAIIALGSNVGDARENVLHAARLLQQFSRTPVLRSSLWRTAPVNCPPGSPEFVNAVALIQPCEGETPETLLGKLQELERAFGRKPKILLNEPRPLDLDLVVFGTEVRATDRLSLPHPRAAARRFVLAPLCELVPELVLPGQSQTVAELLRLSPQDGFLQRLTEPHD